MQSVRLKIKQIVELVQLHSCEFLFNRLALMQKIVKANSVRRETKECSKLNKYITFFSVCVYCDRSQTSHRANNKKVRHETKLSGVTVVLYTL